MISIPTVLTMEKRGSVRKFLVEHGRRYPSSYPTVTATGLVPPFGSLRPGSPRCKGWHVILTRAGIVTVQESAGRVLNSPIRYGFCWGPLDVLEMFTGLINPLDYHLPPVHKGPAFYVQETMIMAVSIIIVDR